ncbi:MAG: M67 family metallopeptidase [Deltaproteobacteria bacterium]|jgi:proteasome lid subunit RPN8/RPN11|nr:M67 family metallopeptidase [Deltaproteobacteria bacterium]
MISLSEELRLQIIKEGEKAYPYECCGLILGSVDGDKKLCISLIPINNSREGEDRLRRFVIEPSDFLKAETKAARLGQDIVSVYHSHPDHPAKPSQYDLDNALPFYSYLILEVAKGSAGALTSWLLQKDRSAFTQEELITLGDSTR